MTVCIIKCIISCCLQQTKLALLFYFRRLEMIASIDFRIYKNYL